METSREKHFIVNTMTCLIKACEGYEVQVDLRDNSEVNGLVSHVDGFMNISMSDVTLKTKLGHLIKFEQFFVKSRQIRYVHIPDEIDMWKAMQGVCKTFCRIRAQQRISQSISQAAWSRLAKKEDEVARIENLQERQKTEALTPEGEA
ncbi:hypothetical protein CHS0354_009276 [Potamilus streckersoni]|uniref:Sm domain-containing protein n=1 Tax=Potamilus streckersoni TaxID=2493646 RepID=A0AAE0W902_9BIVA|nr:hypothetical protein CHS0354_009276 [Potamilus streckersoni]